MSFFDDWVEPYITGEISQWVYDDGTPIDSWLICDLLGGVDPIDGDDLTPEKVDRHLGRTPA